MGIPGEWLAKGKEIFFYSKFVVAQFQFFFCIKTIRIVGLTDSKVYTSNTCQAIGNSWKLVDHETLSA